MGRTARSAARETAEQLIHRTIEYWQGWVRGCAIGRYYQTDVIRSALVLKLHQYEDTGAIIASGTTSLPEAPNTAATGTIATAGCATRTSA